MQREWIVILTCGVLAVVLAILVTMRACRSLGAPSDLALRGNGTCPSVYIPRGTYKGSLMGQSGTLTLSDNLFASTVSGAHTQPKASLSIPYLKLDCDDVPMTMIDLGGAISFGDNPAQLDCVTQSSLNGKLTGLKGVYRPEDNSIAVVVTTNSFPHTVSTVLRPAT